jgi:hypothetical protein
MIRSLRPRKTIPDSLNRQLNSYALAASAAGVGALALAQTAEAKIVYTPAHVILQANQPFPLDLNHDGIVDFYLFHGYNKYDSSENSLQACRSISYNSNNEVGCRSNPMALNAIRATESMGKSWGAALRTGARIQNGKPFLRDTHPVNLGYVISTLFHGPWANGGKGVKNRYLGVKFQINGRSHFGWARKTVTPKFNGAQWALTTTLTGYAYETIPGKGIVAGKTKGSDVTTVYPANLGHLAAGASAIPAWRVKHTAATS